jgi:hypothetical protein
MTKQYKTKNIGASTSWIKNFKNIVLRLLDPEKEAIRRTETSVNQTKIRNISEDLIVQQHICENLLFHTVYVQQMIKTVTKLEICIC